jgi:hypothetical protein
LACGLQSKTFGAGLTLKISILISSYLPFSLSHKTNKQIKSAYFSGTPHIKKHSSFLHINKPQLLCLCSNGDEEVVESGLRRRRQRRWKHPVGRRSTAQVANVLEEDQEREEEVSHYNIISSYFADEL